MSIAYQWREATGTNVSMLLIESRADNLPPHWQVTIHGDAWATVAVATETAMNVSWARKAALSAAETLEEIAAI